jgi:hypothetical protein
LEVVTTTVNGSKAETEQRASDLIRSGADQTRTGIGWRCNAHVVLGDFDLPQNVSDVGWHDGEALADRSSLHAVVVAATGDEHRAEQQERKADENDIAVFADNVTVAALRSERLCVQAHSAPTGSQIGVVNVLS